MKLLLIITMIAMFILTIVSAVRGQQCMDLDVLHVEFMNETANVAEMIQVQPSTCVGESVRRECGDGVWQDWDCDPGTRCQEHPVEMKVYEGSFMTEEFIIVNSDENHTIASCVTIPEEPNETQEPGVGFYIWPFFMTMLALAIIAGVII